MAGIEENGHFQPSAKLGYVHHDRTGRSTLRHLLLTFPALEVRHDGMPAVHVLARFETTGLGAQRRATRMVEHAMRNGEGPIVTGGEHPWR